jgi:hypothetical protein
MHRTHRERTTPGWLSLGSLLESDFFFEQRMRQALEKSHISSSASYPSAGDARAAGAHCWGENTIVPRFSLPKPHTFLPSLCGSVEDRAEMLVAEASDDAADEGCCGSQQCYAPMSFSSADTAVQSTGCEEKNSQTSPQQPVLSRLTFNTAASLSVPRKLCKKRAAIASANGAERSCCVPRQCQARTSYFNSSERAPSIANALSGHRQF